MSNLYRELRPNNFKDVLGNKAILEQLDKFSTKHDIPHVYLLTGGSGCGKTTIARIYAQLLGADELSIREKNIADNRGIDTMREIIEQMRYKPINGKPLIYIFDEFHMATKEAQSAMLKPFEDTPNHVFFIICTTDPQKIIPTIKTRCTKFEVEQIDEEKLYRYLFRICKTKEFEVDKVVLRKIAEACEGSVRQALVLLEQVLQITEVEDQLQAVKYGVESSEVIDLCRSLLKKNWNSCRSILNNLKKQNIEVENARYAVLGYMTTVLLSKGDSQAIWTIDCFSENTYDTKFAGLVKAAYESCHP